MEIPKLKGVEALLQKTSPQAPPQPQAQPNPYAPEELEAIDQHAEAGEAFTGAEVMRLLDTLAVYGQMHDQEANGRKHLQVLLMALAFNRGGMIEIRKGWIEEIDKLTQPAMQIERGDGLVRVRLKFEPKSIVLAKEVPIAKERA